MIISSITSTIPLGRLSLALISGKKKIPIKLGRTVISKSDQIVVDIAPATQCKNCEKDFVKKRRDQKHCGERCARLFANRVWWKRHGKEWRNKRDA